MIFLDLEYDMESISFRETINVDLYSEVYGQDSVEMDITKTRASLSYWTGEYYRIVVSYYRVMNNEYSAWTNRRNTGLKLTWSFTEDVQPNYRYAEGRFS